MSNFLEASGGVVGIVVTAMLCVAIWFGLNWLSASLGHEIAWGVSVAIGISGFIYATIHRTGHR